MTHVFYSNKNPKQLENVINNALDNIENWLKANKLMLNVKKSNLILFNIKKNSKSTSDSNIKIYIGSDKLEHKKKSKKYQKLCTRKKIKKHIYLLYKTIC